MVEGDQRFTKRLDYLARVKSANKLQRAGIELAKRIRRLMYVLHPVENPKSLDSSKVIVVTIAFNNPDLVGIQAEALRKFLHEDYTHIVVDNSPDDHERAEVRTVAESWGSVYLPAPSNPYSWIDPSVSHAFALDWAWHQVVAKLKPEIAVYLDHDVFPTKPSSFRRLLGDKLVAGYQRKSEQRWLLWPGLFVVGFPEFSKFRVSFMPKADTDAGGSLWWTVYSKIAPERIRFLGRQVVAFGDTSKRYVDGSPGEIHVFEDGWVHLVDGSGWSDGVAKMERLPRDGMEGNLQGIIRLVTGNTTEKEF